MDNAKNSKSNKNFQKPSVTEQILDALRSQSIERASEAFQAARGKTNDARDAVGEMSREEEGFAILAALMQRDAEALAVILELGVDPNAPISASGTTGLMLAIHNQDQAAIRLLLPVSDTTITSLQGVSALSAACLREELDLKLIRAVLPKGGEWKIPKEASSARWAKSQEPSALWELANNASAGWIRAARIVLPHVDVFCEHRGKTALDLMVAGGVSDGKDAHGLRWMRDAMAARDNRRTQELIGRRVREFHQKVESIREAVCPGADKNMDQKNARMVAIDLRDRAEDIFLALDALASPEMSEESLSLLTEIGAWMQCPALLSGAQKEANALRREAGMERATEAAPGTKAAPETESHCADIRQNSARRI